MSETAELIAAPESTVGSVVSNLDEQLQHFRGSSDPRTTVVSFLREEAARREAELDTPYPAARSDAPEDVVAVTVQPMCDYLLLIQKIGQAMCDEVNKEFGKEEVRVVQVRTSFDFRHWFIKVLFIMDADPERELRLSQMVNDLERIVLLSDSFAAELDYVNRRDGNLDCDLLRRQYPFVAKVRASS